MVKQSFAISTAHAKLFFLYGPPVFFNSAPIYYISLTTRSRVRSRREGGGRRRDERVRLNFRVIYFGDDGHETLFEIAATCLDDTGLESQRSCGMRWEGYDPATGADLYDHAALDFKIDILSIALFCNAVNWQPWISVPSKEGCIFYTKRSKIKTPLSALISRDLIYKTVKVPVKLRKKTENNKEQTFFVTISKAKSKGTSGNADPWWV